MINILLYPFINAQSSFLGGLIAGLGSLFSGGASAAALASAAAPAAGALASAAYTKHQQTKANKQSVWLANTAYQRQAADLQAAGINRALGYTKGSGAQAPEMKAAVNSQAILNSASAAKLLAESKYIDQERQAQIANTIQATNTAWTQQLLNTMNARKSSAEVHRIMVDAQQKIKQIEHLESQIQMLGVQIGTAKHQQRITEVEKQKANIESELMSALGMHSDHIGKLGVVGAAGLVIRKYFEKKAAAKAALAAKAAKAERLRNKERVRNHIERMRKRTRNYRR
jgi:hypothetical protein